MSGGSSSFAAGDRPVVNDCDRPAGTREKIRARQSGDTGADDAHVYTQVAIEREELGDTGFHPYRCRISGIAWHLGEYRWRCGTGYRAYDMPTLSALTRPYEQESVNLFVL